MSSEPTLITQAINAALVATLAMLTGFDIISKEAAASIGTALAAWIVVVATILRQQVTPIEQPKLTQEQVDKVTIIPS